VADAHNNINNGQRDSLSEVYLASRATGTIKTPCTKNYLEMQTFTVLRIRQLRRTPKVMADNSSTISVLHRLFEVTPPACGVAPTVHY